MFEDFRTADIIAYHCSRIDLRCRQELQRNILVSERDYVTSLTTRIRDEISELLGLKSHAQTVRPRVENENGVDGIIVFQSGNEIKAGLFEAKRPQVNINNYRWDYLSARYISHFSEQIEKQRIWKGQLALWEMFLNEGLSGFESPPFDYFGSSCVWHDNAYNFMHRENLIFQRWTTDKLKLLLTGYCVNFYSVIYDIISCKEGTKHKVNIKTQTCRIVNPKNDNITMNIPIPTEFGIDRDERIDEFLTKNGLDNYMFIDLNRNERIKSTKAQQ